MTLNNYLIICRYILTDYDYYYKKQTHMWYMNKHWKIVSSKMFKEVNIVKKNHSIKNKHFYYIGKTWTTGKEIVYYEWIILTEEDENWIVTVKYKDRSLKRNPNWDKKTIEVKLKYLTY